MITGDQAIQAQVSDRAFSKAVDRAIREENRRAIAGEPSQALEDPLLEGFFSLTLEEIRQKP